MVSEVPNKININGKMMTPESFEVRRHNWTEDYRKSGFFWFLRNCRFVLCGWRLLSKTFLM